MRRCRTARLPEPSAATHNGPNASPTRSHNMRVVAIVAFILLIVYALLVMYDLRF